MEPFIVACELLKLALELIRLYLDTQREKPTEGNRQAQQ